MSAVERPTDGPDTELAAAIGFLARNEGLLIEMEHSPAGRAAATIVRAVLARPDMGLLDMDRDGAVEAGVRLAVPPEPGLELQEVVALAIGGAIGHLESLGYPVLLGASSSADAVLARPAAGRDLTAQDVEDTQETWTGGTAQEYRQFAADYLTRIARPAVARTDGQPPAEGLDPLAHVQPGHAADDMLCGDQHGPWNCTRDLQHPGQHIASIGHGQRVGAVWPAAPADEPAPTFRSARSRRRGEIADPAADLAAYDRVLADVPADYPGLPLMQARREELRALAAGAAAPADTPTCRYCGADCSGGRSWDGGDLYACQSCADARATRNAAPADDTAAPAPVVGYVLARVDDSTVTLWDDDVRETGHAAAVAHVEQVDQPGPWRCYELRDVCTDADQPVRGSQPEATRGGDPS